MKAAVKDVMTTRVIWVTAAPTTRASTPPG